MARYDMVLSFMRRFHNVAGNANWFKDNPGSFSESTPGGWMKNQNRRLPSITSIRRLFSCSGFFILAAGEGFRKRTAWLAAVEVLVFLAIAIPTAAQDSRGVFVSGERQALVIGNNAYQTAPLQNPENDAEDMSRVLSELGFQVVLRKNADLRSMEDAIRAFGRQLRSGGVGLFYFAGHGMQVEGRNFLIPVNARIDSESDVKYEAVDAGFVLGKMEDAKNQLNIVILDACRNNPFSRSFRAADRGLARMDAPTGSLVVYATAPGEVAADGPARNGVFTRHLIKHMQTPNLTVEQILKRVRIDVAAETKQRQIPWESSSLMGDFYFKPVVASDASMKSSSIQSEKTGESSPQPLAKIDITKKIDSKRQTGVAILPFNVQHQSPKPLTTSRLEEEIINRLVNFLINHQSFNIEYSFYKFDRYQKNDLLFEILSEKERSYLWKNETIFSPFFEPPDFEILREVGDRLRTDVILTYRCLIQTNGMYFGAYLFDVKNKKLIKEVIAHREFISSGSEISYLELAFKEATSNVIKKYSNQ
jgi:hypothetical protein